MMSARAFGIIGAFALALLVGGCQRSPAAGVLQMQETPTAVHSVLATRPSNRATAEPMLSPATMPTFTAASLPPTITPSPSPVTSLGDAVNFCCLRFASDIEAPTAETFPAGTETVFAFWEYEGLMPGDRVRRIWFRDDLIWLTRDEVWDFTAYGPRGTVRDVSIYDFEGEGLAPARYRLQLYLNDVFQMEGAFTILPP